MGHTVYIYVHKNIELNNAYFVTAYFVLFLFFCCNDNRMFVCCIRTTQSTGITFSTETYEVFLRARGDVFKANEHIEVTDRNII